MTRFFFRESFRLFALFEFAVHTSAPDGGTGGRKCDRACDLAWRVRAARRQRHRQGLGQRAHVIWGRGIRARWRQAGHTRAS